MPLALAEHHILEKAPDLSQRLLEYTPVGIVDIGSNSVRLVVYDGARRSPTPVFNEKVLCGLGRGVAASGRMQDVAVERALAALVRFRALCRQVGTVAIYAFATAAVREANNGPEFVASAEAALGHEVEVLSGRTEAQRAALGVLSGMPDAEGLVGDLGGGSLELVELKGGEVHRGATLPLGPLRLMEESDGVLKKARKLVDKIFDESSLFDNLKAQRFYAVGGAWRNLARLHMAQNHYPLHIIHGYTIERRAARAVANLVSGLSAQTLRGIVAINPNRAEALPYASLVLEQVLKRVRVKSVVVSAYGVREGILFERLSEAMREADPLLAACRDLARLRGRSPEHAQELAAWTDQLYGGRGGLSENTEQRRLRHAACLLADIGWRAHPDYRGEQSMTIVSQAAFVGVDHPGRVFLALTVYHRYEGVWSDGGNERFEELVDDDTVYRARIVSAAQRLAYVLSACMPGALPHVHLKASRKNLTLTLGGAVADLAGERVEKRLSDLAALMNRKPVITIQKKPGE